MCNRYEADRNRIILYDVKTKERRILANSWDHSPFSIIFSADSSMIFASAEDRGHGKLFAIIVASEVVHEITHKHSSFSVSLLDHLTLIFFQSSLTSPAEVFTLSIYGKGLRQLTKFHTEALAKIEMPVPEEFWFRGAKGHQVHGWLVKPAGFVEGKKYPLGE